MNKRTLSVSRQERSLSTEDLDLHEGPLVLTNATFVPARGGGRVPHIKSRPSLRISAMEDRPCLPHA